MSPTWLSAWWRAMHDAPVDPFGKRTGFGVGLRDEQGELRGLALFCRRWARDAAVPRLRLDILGTGEPKADEVCTDYATVLAAPEDRDDVARGLVAALLGNGALRWDDVVLPMMRRDDPMLDALVRAFVRRGLDVDLARTGTSTMATLRPTFDAYLASLPKKHRYAIKRSVSDFESWAAGLGGHTFERVDRPADLPRGLETLIALHAARWGASHLFTSRRFHRFHEEVTRSMIEGVDAKLDLWILRAGERPVAALYNIAAGRTVSNYQAGRVMDLPRGIKPGIVANVYALKQAIADGFTEYDFLPGEALYKHQLGNAELPVVTLRVSRSDARAVGLDLLTSVVRRAAWSIDSAPRRSRGDVPPTHEASAGGD